MGGKTEAESGNKAKKQGAYSIRFLENFHDRFLQTLRKTQPLATMTSFSIVIAAFSGSRPFAQQYAVGAGFMFLAAFLLSSAVSFGVRGGLLELYSYISTGFGMVFLGLVLWEYALTTQAFGSALGAINDIAIAIVAGLALAPVFLRDILKRWPEKPRSKRWVLSVGFNLSGTALAAFNLSYFLLQASTKLVSGSASSASSVPSVLIGWTVGLLVGKISARYEPGLKALLKKRRGLRNGGAAVESPDT